MYAISSEKIVIGVDIGGTNIVAAAVSAQGDLLARKTGPTLPKLGQDDAVRRLVEMIRDVGRIAGGREVAGVGIGCTGPVDRLMGTVHNPYTLPTWDGFPIAHRLVEALDLPVVLENDAHAGALGEHWQGAGRGTQHMIYVTIGTGIGAGLLLNGDLYTGATGTAGEIGHHSVDINGARCYCGGVGCVEVYAAAPALTQRARERATSSSALLALVDGDLARLDAEIICRAAREGDRIAYEIIDYAARALAVGLGNLVHILVPEVVVLGGGVMRSFDLFEPVIQETFDRFRFPLGDLRVVRAALGTNAGVIGAARAVLDRCYRP